jgi:hypothetical protein
MGDPSVRRGGPACPPADYTVFQGQTHRSAPTRALGVRVAATESVARSMGDTVCPPSTSSAKADSVAATQRQKTWQPVAIWGRATGGRPQITLRSHRFVGADLRVRPQIALCSKGRHTGCPYDFYLSVVSFSRDGWLPPNRFCRQKHGRLWQPVAIWGGRLPHCHILPYTFLDTILITITFTQFPKPLFFIIVDLWNRQYTFFSFCSA